MKLLFWIASSLVVYTYVGYPLVLWVFAKIRSRGVLKKNFYPSVSIIIAARNEADKIRQKIDNTLVLDYLAERREILVASDASDDATDEIVKEYGGHGVHLVRAPQRRGKEYVQGLAASVATPSFNTGRAAPSSSARRHHSRPSSTATWWVRCGRCGCASTREPCWCDSDLPATRDLLPAPQRGEGLTR